MKVREFGEERAKNGCRPGNGLFSVDEVRSHLLEAAPVLALRVGMKKPGEFPGFVCWWRWRELNPRPRILRRWLYMLIRLY